MRPGYWCLHCERVWLAENVTEKNGCPADDCDGHAYDLWKVTGTFQNGDEIALYGGQFDELLTKV